jgi:MFS family permease
MFFQPQYLQDALGHSAILSGILILPVTAPMVFISPFSGRLIGRFGARRLMSAGMLFGVAGLAVLTQIAPDTSYGLVLMGYLLFGIAIGLVYAPMSTAAMAAMPAEKVGIASGVLVMDRIVAGSLALAATGAAFHALQVGGKSFTASIAGSTWSLEKRITRCIIDAFISEKRDRGRPGRGGTSCTFSATTSADSRKLSSEKVK